MRHIRDRKYHQYEEMKQQNRGMHKEKYTQQRNIVVGPPKDGNNKHIFWVKRPNKTLSKCCRELKKTRDKSLSCLHYHSAVQG